MSAPTWFALHGFAGGPQSWDRVAASFRGHRLERPIIAGHGPDPVAVAVGESPFEVEVARIEGLMGATPTSAGRFLVGYSLGGRLALGLLARREVRFDGAVLIGAHPGLRSERQRRDRRAGDEEWARLIECEGLAEFERRWSALPLFASQRRLGAEILERQRNVRRGHRPSDLAAAMRALSLSSMPSRWPVLGAIEIPVWLVVGALDEKFGALAEEMVRLLPNGMVRQVPECGHNPLLEAPGKLARILDELQERVGVGVASRQDGGAADG